MTGGRAGGPGDGLLKLSHQQLAEIRGWAAGLRASQMMQYHSDRRCLDALIDRLGTLITSAGGPRPRPVVIIPGEDWIRDAATLTHERLREIRALASRLRNSPAVTPAEKTTLDDIIARTDSARRLRHDREEYWAEKGEPMPAFLTHTPATQVTSQVHPPG